MGEEGEDLLTYAWRNWKKGTALNMIDHTLRGHSSSEITRCIHVGLLCVQENEPDGPTMTSVVLMLTSNSLCQCRQNLHSLCTALWNRINLKSLCRVNQKAILSNIQ
ncbi:hypothetical protein Patl1_33890 [Pistacia atlantica]|uniref:Uncharacterized protein n=1 Tax=Pistacia atlantica TaxID=434234 RepID=A0ACC0ZVU2_9ROSI|nr:hypothetical protein Patl1_33890 [Pistacia atlantica]